MFPASFSTCTISTVWSESSIALRWRISAAKAALSASSVAFEIGVSTSIGSPSARTTRGKRFVSVFTHCGT